MRVKLFRYVIFSSKQWIAGVPVVLVTQPGGFYDAPMHFGGNDVFYFDVHLAWAGFPRSI